ncbi:hypothetical protein GCM10027347_10420 [Larkinella harenae]
MNEVTEVFEEKIKGNGERDPDGAPCAGFFKTDHVASLLRKSPQIEGHDQQDEERKAGEKYGFVTHELGNQLNF